MTFEVFSSEVHPRKRQYIHDNFKDPVVFDDMCNRAATPDVVLPPHDLYVCGFPCKPFSWLHNRSTLFKQESARPFFAMLHTLKTNLPAVAVLENVMGLKRVMDRVWTAMHVPCLAFPRVLIDRLALVPPR